MEKDFRKETGAAGESQALAFLEAKGLKLLIRNYRCRGGEIDLVMLDRETLALVEVRFRSYEAFGGAAGSVDSRKQQRIKIAARHLLMTHRPFAKLRGRFDVVAVTPQRGGDQCEWIKDAFRM